MIIIQIDIDQAIELFNESDRTHYPTAVLRNMDLKNYRSFCESIALNFAKYDGIITGISFTMNGGKFTLLPTDVDWYITL